MVTDRMRRGQALIEMALGMFALALVVSALSLFAVYIARSLKVQNALRVDGGSKSDSIEVDAFAAENFAGTRTLTIREKLRMPSRTIDFR